VAKRDDCIDDILKNIKDRRDRHYVEEHLEDLYERADADDSGLSWGQKLAQAAREMLEEQAIKTAVLRRNLRMDALKFRDLRTFVDAAATAKGGSHQLGIEARLVGVNTTLFDPKSRQGNQSSAAAKGLGAQKDWIGGAVTDMERASAQDPKFRGLDKLFYSRKIENEIFIEKAELEAGDRGRPGRTNNPAARKIAEILVKWDKVEMNALNGEGAWITPTQRHVAELSWDPDKLRKAGKGNAPIYSGPTNNVILYRGFGQADREAFVAKMLPRLDVKRMFGAQAKDADKILAEMYGGLVTGDHLQLATVGEGPIFPSVARKVSQSRSFVFKTAEDQLAAMKDFGRFSPTDQWLHTKKTAANQYGLMKDFGSKPKEMFEEILAYAKNRTMGKPERRDLDKWEMPLRNRFAVVSGEADRPIQNMLSGLVNGVMAVQRLAKLGLTPFAMLQDNVTISRELARQGMGVMERNASIFSGYFQGAEQSAKREVAELLHTGILGRLRGVTARYDVADARSGTMAWLENKFFKISGITAMTENKRADAERMMAFHMGRQRGKEFAALGADEQRTLRSFGIGDREWALLHKAEWTKIEDELYLTPDVASKISDADADAHLKAEGSISARAAAAVQGPDNAAATGSTAAERLRQDLALKLWSYYSERGQFAVLEVGPRERAMLYQGTQPGSKLNIALRLLLQFKQFPTAMFTKAWGAEVYGGRGAGGAVAGLTELIVASTAFGILANGLNALAKGQDPMSRWRDDPLNASLSGFLRGGAGSIYGDFLLGEWSRFGMSALDTIAGPTFGQTNRIFELYSDLTHPTSRTGVVSKPGAAGALALRVARDNAPFMNMIYTKAAFDYLIYYRLAEMMNPGFLQRMEQGMKDKQGTEFLLRPSQVSR
jgi:hypothetical protein